MGRVVGLTKEMVDQRKKPTVEKGKAEKAKIKPEVAKADSKSE